MDEAGQRNFSKALAVAKQIFNSLTEYIQVTENGSYFFTQLFSFNQYIYCNYYFTLIFLDYAF